MVSGQTRKKDRDVRGAWLVRGAHKSSNLDEGLALQGDRSLLHTSALLKVLLQSHGVDRVQGHVGLMADQRTGGRVGRC